MGTSGKNVQKGFPALKPKEAYEIKGASTLTPNADHISLFSSSAPRQRVPRNYGPRRMRYRWVDNLKPWQVRMLYDADEIAAHIGLPLNTFMTINYQDRRR